VLVVKTSKTGSSGQGRLSRGFWRLLGATDEKVTAHSMAEVSASEAFADKAAGLDDEQLAWARATGDHENDGAVEFHTDSNGQRLSDGDTVVLVKTLDVKGTSFSARAGTVVKNIRLIADNVEQVEGKIENQQIVILTKYVRKG
jgi:protein PhnA